MEKLISEEGHTTKIFKLLDDGRALLTEHLESHVCELPLYKWRTFLTKREQLNLYQALGEAINPQGGIK